MKPRSFGAAGRVAFEMPHRFRMVWDHVDVDSVNLQDRLARRAHCGDDDALVQIMALMPQR
jgi:hypothetical protein